ncbi:MAG: hypothetical protein CBC42_05720 [Betaproteobacteria bacterium TMED82]|nr:MAG: hypothetical protein CBC42_05720 [Betaproteobacteria bacterium TMED82]|tara:strand:- start:8690 stop:10264 length:1575 start_codon:yes stop_codon:yes gene_type:complete
MNIKNIVPKLTALLTLTITLFICIKFYSIFSNDLLGQVALATDEIQYLFWSKQLEFGYFSKPPFIALVLRVSSELCTETGPCVRVLQPLAITVATFFVIATTHLFTKSLNLSFLAGLLFISLPLITFYSQFATTDAWLLCFWSVSFFCFANAIYSDRLYWWLTCGVFIGLGLLTKYSMMFFLISAFIFLISTKSLSSYKPWLSLVTVLLVFSPNIFWNISLEFPTLQHHLEMTAIDQSISLNFSSLLEFFLGQLIVLNPIFFVLFVFTCIFYFKRRRAKVNVFKRELENSTRKFELLFYFIFPFFFSILVLSLIGETEINWASPISICFCILIVVWLKDCQQLPQFRSSLVNTALGLGITLNVLFLILFLNGPKLLRYHGLENNINLNPYAQVYGYQELANALKPTLEKHNPIIVSDDRNILANLSVYLHPFKVKTQKNAAKIDHHWDLMYALSPDEIATKELLIIFHQPINEDSLARLKLRLASKFKKVTLIRDEVISNLKLARNKEKGIMVFLVSNIKPLNL